MIDLDDIIKQARAAAATPETIDQDVLLQDEILTVRFAIIEGQEWRDLTALHPPRAGSVLDSRRGYNLDAVVANYPKVEVFADGEKVPLEAVDRLGATYSRWGELVSLLAAPDLENLAAALWGAHEWAATQRMLAAGKAQKGGLAKKPGSPVSSE